MAGFPLHLPPIFLPRYLFKYIERLDLCNKLRILNMLHGAGLLFTSQLAVIEMIYKKVCCYSMVMEIVATALSTVEMASDCGYSEMKREGQMAYDKGPAVYCFTIIGNVVMVFLTSSLTGGICMMTILAVNAIGGSWFTATALVVLRLFRL